MRILRTYLYLPPYPGGMEKHISTLTKYQLDKKIFVKIFYCKGQSVSKFDQKINTFNIYKIRPQFINFILFYVSVISKLIFRKETYNIVHMHGDWSSLLFIKILKKITKSQVMALTIHDQLFQGHIRLNILLKLIKDVDLVFTTGHIVAKQLRENGVKNVVVQPSGINEKFFKSFKKRYVNKIFTVVIVANLLPKKNIELVIEIALNMKDCRFLIIGDGPHEKTLNNKIKEEGVNNVELTGFKNSEYIRHVYQNSDCYLLTSFSEGTPTSLLEAMACGLPIISSNAGGVKAIVLDSINGFIIEDFDKNKFIEMIYLIKNDEMLRKKMFKENIFLSKNYKWDRVSENITSIMEEKLKLKRKLT